MIKKSNNKGITVVFLAICIVTLCALVGLAVDIGYMYVTKGQLQNAADAAALAGALKINPLMPVQQQYSARSTAQAIALQNKAATSPVAITSNATENTLADDNDITFGNWTRATGFVEGGTPVNAIHVRARRNVPGATPENQGQVSIFFGKVIGWPYMSAGAEAYAICELTTPGMVICTNTCSSNSIPTLISACSSSSSYPTDGPPGAAFLQLSPTLSTGEPQMCSIAWTAFTTVNNISLGPNGNVQQLINGTSGPIDLCNLPCFTTQQGTGNAWDTFQTAYNTHKDSSGHWTVGMPVVDNSIVNPTCTSQGGPTGCPPSDAGNPTETYNPIGFARIRIAGLKTSGPGGARGLWIDQITCVSCGSGTPLWGSSSKLVDSRPNP